MTDIICKWLGEDVRLSKDIEPTNFAKEFSTGYLLGEILYKYDLQRDFDQFSTSKNADSKLNNFTRLEPTLHLLEIPFDTNTAREVMTEKQGTATRLVYQLFIALNKKVKSNLTGVAMQTMRASAPVKLENVESCMYKERLKHMTPRQTDIGLESLGDRFHSKQIEMEKTAFKERFEEEERHIQALQEQREALISKYKENRMRKSEVLAKIQAAAVHIPKPPPNKTAKAIQKQREMRKKREAMVTEKDIDAFEDRLKRSLPPSDPFMEGGEDFYDPNTQIDINMDPLDMIRPGNNSDYIGKIRKRLNEDSAARVEREKRRRKVLVDQMKAHEAQEEARREEMLVNRLMRQSQQERKIAVQLLQARKEKEIIKKNRLMKEKQHEERRLRDFEDALYREAEMARLAKLEYVEQTALDRELHDKMAAERAEARYQKHYDFCADILDDMLDFTTKIGEYRELTNKLLPPKLMREWTQLFVEGLPLYEQPVEIKETSDEPTTEMILEEERQLLLDEGDFGEYRNMIGEWEPPEESGIPGPPRNNPIVGHIVQRLFDLVHPPAPPPPPPEFPPYPIKALLLGKTFSGKSSVTEKLEETHRIAVLDVDVLVREAIDAFKDGEIIEEEEDDPNAPLEEKLAKALSSIGTPIQEGDQVPVDANPELDAVKSTKSVNKMAKSAKSTDKALDKLPPDNKALEEATAANQQDVEKKDEGTEKGDPEKPVDEDEELEVDPKVTASVKSLSSMKSFKSKTNKPQATPRAKLGAKAMKCLKKGKPVDDQIMVDTVIEKLRRLPEETGWIIDGFPCSYNQAKMLEKALTGLDSDTGRDTRKSSVISKDDIKKKKKKSELVTDPKPAPPPPEPVSGINVVVLLDIPNELALKRAAGRTVAPQGGDKYQLEFNPPPEGSATGCKNQEQVVPVEDPANDEDQMQHRLISFNDSWPKLEKWFMKFGNLQSVDACQGEETVYLEVENILDETIRKLEEPPPEPEPEILVIEQLPPEPEPEQVPEPVPEPPVEEEPPEERSSSKRRSRSGSKGKKGDKKDKSKSPGRSDSGGKKSGKGSRASSAESNASPIEESSKDSKGGKKGKGKGKDKDDKAGSAKKGKKGKTPEPEPEPEPEPPGTPPPLPGTDEWVYVDKPLDDELAQILCPHWEVTEEAYIHNLKKAFRNVRDEKENIYRYFYQIRQNFLDYLKRPDTKNEHVEAWQKEFNEMRDDVRNDEETRAEWHQKVDDLRELLWTICDERKENAEKERSDVMHEGWLEDRLGLLTNTYITMSQAEVDRYQETVRVLKDYYRGMDGKIPDELQAEYVRVPLVELPPTGSSDGAETDEQLEGTVGGTSENTAAPAPQPPVTPTLPQSPSHDEARSPSKTGTPKHKKGGDASEETTTPAEGVQNTEEKSSRIPLVPRRPVSPDPATVSKKEKAKAKGKGSNEPLVESPVPPTDLDERLVFDAHWFAVQAIDRVIAAEQAAKAAEEEAERKKEMEKEVEKEADKKGGKKGKGGKDKKGGKEAKSRSPSPKKEKGGKTPSPKGKKGKGGKTPVSQTPPPPPETPEEAEKRKHKERAKQEFFAAMEEEAVAAKVRLDLIKQKAITVIQALKVLGTEAYTDMNDWLGARFLKEMESIDHMSEIMRHAIELGERIKEPLLIFQDEFQVEGDHVLLKSPSPEPRPPAVETVMQDAFTVDQIVQVYNQFGLTAPSGVLTVKAFQEIFTDLTSLSQGTEQMPDAWMGIPPEKFDQIGLNFSPDGEYVDWRAFLLQAAHPWPIPTQADLLDTLMNFQSMDQQECGYVTREQFTRVNLWFQEDSKPVTPEDPQAAYPYDRLGNLRVAFFDLFADHNMDPPQLDYVSMLLYFSVAPDPQEGFLRALSVAAGCHMPRLQSPQKNKNRAFSQASTLIDIEVSDGDGVRASVDYAEAAIIENIPECAVNSLVPLEALVKVLHHGQSMRGDSHRFSVTADPEDAFSKERLAGVYQECGSEDLEPIKFTTLTEHPVLMDIISSINTYKTVDLKALIANPSTGGPDFPDTTSIRTGEP